MLQIIFRFTLCLIWTLKNNKMNWNTQLFFFENWFQIFYEKKNNKQKKQRLGYVILYAYENVYTHICTCKIKWKVLFSSFCGKLSSFVVYISN